MIKNLSIKNYAIIESIHLDFSKGLNIITGETGAGKSILMGALDLVLGKRADTKSLFDKDKKCIIEAEFDISAYNFKPFFDKNDLDHDTELIVRREISRSGKSRAFINDTPTNLVTLSELSQQLIDMHKQHGSLEIFQTKFQLQILDIVANVSKEVDKYKDVYTSFSSKKRVLADLQDEYTKAKQTYDFNQFQYNELEEAQLVPGEIAKLETTISQLENVEKIQQEVAAAESILDHEQYGTLTTLAKLINRLTSVAKLHPDLEKARDQSLNIQEEIKDINHLISGVTDKLENDPQKLQELVVRQNLLNKLFTKHNVQTEDQLLALRETFGGDLTEFANMEEKTSALKEEIAKLESDLIVKADKISKKRSSVTSKIEKKVKGVLVHLGMKNAELKVELTQEDKLGPYGKDQINFLFSANKGSDFAPIRKVASGGETSRLNLAIKSIVADKAKLPTLVFDEIDTGISGEVALKMGHIFTEMADKHQILSITHSPQIAARADRHFHIYKEDTNNKTSTKLNVLEDEERIFEIAKMLSGDPPSKAAINNAKELLT